MPVTLTPPVNQVVISACLHLRRRCPAGAHLQVRAIQHRRLSPSIIWELPCSKQHWAHTEPDKRPPWQLAAGGFRVVVFFRATEFRISICEPVEGFELCKQDKERQCGLMCLTWSQILCHECNVIPLSKLRRL